MTDTNEDFTVKRLTVPGGNVENLDQLRHWVEARATRTLTHESPEMDNETRAWFAANALLAYVDLVGSDLDTAINDLYNDFHHLIDGLGFDADEEFSSNYHYVAEASGEDF